MIVFNAEKEKIRWKQIDWSDGCFSVVYKSKTTKYYVQATIYDKKIENRKHTCFFELKDGERYATIIANEFTREEFENLRYDCAIIYDAIHKQDFKNISHFYKAFSLLQKGIL